MSCDRIELFNKHYWSAVLTKLVETFISVKAWVLFIATYFAFNLISLYTEIHQTILHLSNNPHVDYSTIEILSLLTPWSSKLLDVTLAMFTGVIVVVTLSREVFKHAKISKSYNFSEESEIKRKNDMV